VIRVGTCAFTDHQGLYPPGVKPGERLRWYARQFSVVEVDAPFYRALPPAVAERWVLAVPPTFQFDIKAPGSLTGHRPPDPDELHVFTAFLDVLAAHQRLGAVLLQWPPWQHATAAGRTTVEQAIRRLTPYLAAVEFRHTSWYRHPDDLIRWLTQLHAVHVVVDAPSGLDTAVPWHSAVANPQLAYVRFHGRNRETWSAPGLATSQERFRYQYSPEELASRVPDLQHLDHTAAGVHVLMNNNYGSYAVDGARWLRDHLAPLPGTQTTFDW
jgi:uncharacterized protein YecE (DUF72 family)